MTAGLRVEALRVARGGKIVLHGVDLAIAPGRITALNEILNRTGLSRRQTHSSHIGEGNQLAVGVVPQGEPGAFKALRQG